MVWLRAWFRYMRQTGVAFSLATVVDALRRAPEGDQGAGRACSPPRTIPRRPAAARRRVKQRRSQVRRCAEARSAGSTTTASCGRCARSSARRLRTNAFAPQAAEALAFKIDIQAGAGPSGAGAVSRDLGLFSPRVEGIHLRGGPIARGGLRWSDRRDDFRTEILGLMKAQLVKNAVIVPTGAKGGFYPKQLPNPAVDRDAWLAEGTESYRIFIRSLLSVTDNIVDGQGRSSGRRRHPRRRRSLFRGRRRQGHRDLLRRRQCASRSSATSGWATPSPAAGRNGYDHKAMGITAKGAWISVQRHFLEMGVDVQTEPVRVVGCGDMSGDVFGNGMLLVEGAQAGRGIRPSPHLHRSRSRSGQELGRAQADVRPAALELGRL